MESLGPRLPDARSIAWLDVVRFVMMRNPLSHVSIRRVHELSNGQRLLLSGNTAPIVRPHILKNESRILDHAGTTNILRLLNTHGKRQLVHDARGGLTPAIIAMRLTRFSLEFLYVRGRTFAAKRAAANAAMRNENGHWPLVAYFANRLLRCGHRTAVVCV